MMCLALSLACTLMTAELQPPHIRFVDSQAVAEMRATKPQPGLVNRLGWPQPRLNTLSFDPSQECSTLTNPGFLNERAGTLKYCCFPLKGFFPAIQACDVGTAVTKATADRCRKIYAFRPHQPPSSVRKTAVKRKIALNAPGGFREHAE